MSLIPGKYQHYKNENIDAYFSSVGVPYIPRKLITMTSPLLEITQNGDQWNIKNHSYAFTLDSSFKINEEYDEKMPTQTIKSKTSVINDHEIETESISPKNGLKHKRHYYFTQDECVLTLTHDNVEAIGKRYFRRIK